MNKHAYLIMFHKNVEQLINLVKILEDERNDIYLHVDADSNDIKVLKEKLKSNCSKIEIIDRQLINWGDTVR